MHKVCFIFLFRARLSLKQLVKALKKKNPKKPPVFFLFLCCSEAHMKAILVWYYKRK